MSHYFTFQSGSPIQVYIQAAPSQMNPSIVEHNVLDVTHSVFQSVGAKSPVTTFQFMLYGQFQMGYIKSCVQSGSPFYWTDNLAANVWYFVPQEFSEDWQQALNYPDRWYKCSIKAAYLDTSGSLFYVGPTPPTP